MFYPSVPIALLNAPDLLATSGVNVARAEASSAACNKESMLKELSDIPQPLCAYTGVAATIALRYFSCSVEEVVSVEVAGVG